jgi:pimeloyl-ACP methyl ester carboxylesterase
VYDFVQQALDPSSDLACVDLLEELLTWCGNLNNPIGSLCDPNNILLVGHSRGAKISSLVASKDSRVKALYLIDPVDVTVYTPLSPEFPSAASALESSSLNQQLPVAIVGSGSGSDCAPSDSSYNVFYKATKGPTWQGIVQSAGHLQFLDARNSTAMGLVCQASANVTDGQVEDVAHAMMIAWAESMMERSSCNDASDRDEIQKILVCKDDGQVRALSIPGNRGRKNVKRAIINTESSFSSIPVDFMSKNLNEI